MAGFGGDGASGDRLPADAIARFDIELTIGFVQSARPRRRLGR